MCRWGTEMEEIETDCSYVIDQNDIIIQIGDSFVGFARKNGWHSDIEPEQVIGRSVFEFIAGTETQHLYRILFEAARRGKSIGPIPFRCDSPDKRRFLELRLEPMSGGYIEVRTKLLRVEEREPVFALEQGKGDSDRLLRMCSMCKKVALADGRWLEIEEALRTMRLFEGEALPQITHGLCEVCFDEVMSYVA